MPIEKIWIPRLKGDKSETLILLNYILPEVDMVRFVPLTVWLPAFCLPAVWLPALYLLWPRIKSLREKIIKNIHFRKFWIITKRWILNLNSIIFGPIFVINWGLSLFLIRYKIMTKIPLAFMYKFRNILHNWTVLKNKRLWTISHKQKDLLF